MVGATVCDEDGMLYNIAMLATWCAGECHEVHSVSCRNAMISEYLSGAPYLYVKHYYTKCENTGSTEATGSVTSLLCSAFESEVACRYSSVGDSDVSEVDESMVSYVVRVCDAHVCCVVESMFEGVSDASYEEAGVAPGCASENVGAPKRDEVGWVV